MLRVESAVVEPGWSRLRRSAAWEPRDRSKGSGSWGSRQAHNGQVLSGQWSARAALLVCLAQRCPLTMTVLDLWVMFVAKIWLKAHCAADWSRRGWRCWNYLTSPESTLPCKLAAGAGSQSLRKTNHAGSGASLAGCLPHALGPCP